MKKKSEKTSRMFHDLLNPVSSTRSIIYYLLMEKERPLDKKTKDYLQECVKYCDELIKKIHHLQDKWKTITSQKLKNQNHQT